MNRLPAMLLGLALLGGGPAIPTAHGAGYGQHRWGASLQELRKKSPRLRLRADDEDVRLEAEVYRRVLRDEEAGARAAGAKALRAWRKKKKPPRRLSAYGHWVRLGDLGGQVTLHLFDRRLYAADVAVLFSAEQKDELDHLLALLKEKYGEPVARHGGEESGGVGSIELSTGDGVVEVFLSPPGDGAHARGLLLLRYQAADGLGRTAQRYLEGLRGRMTELERQRAEQAQQKADHKHEARKAAILDHL